MQCSKNTKLFAKYLYLACLGASAVATTTVVPTKSDSDTIFCLQLLSKALICTRHLI